MTTYAGRIEALFTIPAGGAAMAVTNSGGGPTVVTIPAGEYYLTATNPVSGLLDILQIQLQASRPPAAGAWTVSLSTGPNGDLRVSIACTGATWSITWTSTELRDLLGFSQGDLAVVSGTQTGDDQARGVWGPDCPLDLDAHPQMAPKVTDLRELVSPRGAAIGLIGNSRYVHTRLRYTHVPLSRFREASATLAYASWEAFLEDTQWSDGHSWFGPLSRVQIYDHNLALVGADVDISGWFMRGLDRLATLRATESWTGFWRVDIPELTSDG